MSLSRAYSGFARRKNSLPWDACSIDDFSPEKRKNVRGPFWRTQEGVRGPLQGKDPF